MYWVFDSSCGFVGSLSGFSGAAGGAGTAISCSQSCNCRFIDVNDCADGSRLCTAGWATGVAPDSMSFMLSCDFRLRRGWGRWILKVSLSRVVVGLVVDGDRGDEIKRSAL